MRTAAEAVEWASQHPTRDGGTWSQWCQSFVVRALDLAAAGDANDACLASRIVSMNAHAAPVGAIHWWLNPARSSGHVGVGLGGESVLMTDAPAADQWRGHHTVGITTVARYAAKGTAYGYVGWSLDMAGQALKTSTPAPAGGASPTPIGDDMLDASDKAWLNGLGNAIIAQVLGFAESDKNKQSMRAQLAAQTKTLQTSETKLRADVLAAVKAIAPTLSAAQVDALGKSLTAVAGAAVAAELARRLTS